MTARPMVSGRPFHFLYLVLFLWCISRGGAWIFDMRNAQHMASVDAYEGAREQEGTSSESIHEAMIPRFAQKVSVPGTAQRASSDRGNPQTIFGKGAPVALHPGESARDPAGCAPTGDQSAKGVRYSNPWSLPLPLSRPHGSRLRRWSLTTWFLYRPDSAQTALADVGQLGASQMGARLAYDLTPSSDHGLAIHGRMTRALQSPALAEAAAGLTWQPSRTIPVALSLERRVAIGADGRDAFAAYAAGGFGPRPVFAGWELDGYAQAGVVGAARMDVFADGRIAVAKPLLQEGEALRVTGGFAVSGGAQPSLSRLDVGPQLAAHFPLGRGSARLSLEWRERIAGRARPVSGPALVLAADF